MLQLDNEFAGVHLWRGSPDCNPSALGIGVPDGRYPSFLARRYGTVEALNAAYGSAYTDFASVRPTGQAAVDDCFECSRLSLGDYAEILRDHLRSEGVTEPVCHNAASPGFVPLFREFNRRLGSGFLLGLDSYFQLTWGSGRLAPTPGYLAGSIQLGADLLEEAGNPYTVLEMQSGSYADTPPLLPRPLEAHLMVHMAMVCGASITISLPEETAAELTERPPTAMTTMPPSAQTGKSARICASCGASPA